MTIDDANEGKIRYRIAEQLAYQILDSISTDEDDESACEDSMRSGNGKFGDDDLFEILE
jgi:hypothetical protein